LQGSPLSPLLANIYLHPFDVMMLRRKHRLVRFADDWVILCPNQEAAEAAYNDALAALARLRLKVNPEKTRILRPGERLEWLGAIVK
jgi:retron-type reverse transcriptase